MTKRCYKQKFLDWKFTSNSNRRTAKAQSVVERIPKVEQIEKTSGREAPGTREKGK